MRTILSECLIYDNHKLYDDNLYGEGEEYNCSSWRLDNKKNESPTVEEWREDVK